MNTMSTEYHEELAIISDIHFGVGEHGKAMIYFLVKGLGAESLVYIQGAEALTFVQQNGVDKLEDLEGKPCVISVEDDQMVRFVKLFR